MARFVWGEGPSNHDASRFALRLFALNGLRRNLPSLARRRCRFAAGQILGESLGLTFARLGPLHLGLATIGSLAFLLVGHWLSQAPEKK
jgi:hypothetical protein